MVGKYKVITLCGSTRFKEDFERINKELTLAGNIVISVGLFGHSRDAITDEQKIMLDDTHSIRRTILHDMFNHMPYSPLNISNCSFMNFMTIAN